MSRTGGWAGTHPPEQVRPPVLPPRRRYICNAGERSHAGACYICNARLGVVIDSPRDTCMYPRYPYAALLVASGY
jgi:hypothetical protein